MELEKLLKIRPGVTAVIGGGGKTTLLRALGEELAGKGRSVLLCTTAKIFPFDGLPCVTEPGETALRAAREQARLICAGELIPETGKLTAPAVPMERLAALFDYVLVEADGSAHRPMKAHAPYEPVIPALTGQTVCVVGASGFGLPVREAAHRPELYAQLAGVSLDAPVTPELEARVLELENLHDRVLINQAELAPMEAGRLASMLTCPAAAVYLQEGVRIC